MTLIARLFPPRLTPLSSAWRDAHEHGDRDHMSAAWMRRLDENELDPALVLQPEDSAVIWWPRLVQRRRG